MLNLPKIIRPTGNPIRLKSEAFTNDLFSPFVATFYRSGTAALAAAILASIKHHPPQNDGSPEVILPAYGCPDLVSACIYAGATPVLIDLGKNRPWMDIEKLGNAINTRTVAIIAVRFLGIAEQMEKLCRICQSNALMLIDDSAQGFPLSTTEAYWQGDYNIISFARGKPLNLLGGGAVLSRENTELADLLPIPAANKDNLLDNIKYLLKLSIYNLSIHPTLYSLLTKLPGLNIGSTTYKRLSLLNEIPGFTLKRVNFNYSAYKSVKNVTPDIHQIMQKIQPSAIEDLPSSLGYNFEHPLLRYPLLATDTAQQNQLFSKLYSLGASKMYQKPLYEISGVDKLTTATKKTHPNSKNFSQQLITLPTHSGVTQDTLNRIHSIINSTT